MCRGASIDSLRTAEVGFSSPLTINRLFEGASLSATNFSFLSLAAIAFESPCQFPPLSSGRDVCVLTCTLLL